ncbi:thioredoxin fold domain-containing protein [Aliamphritea spongicola]|uniref:thioredoxin fold domain-containing protein n=1 Tax=Aliamphritea spongicola TaxID=707589 RepID=UPI00196ACE56|nr:thioredoxin fold domain-containing protein [Aliamphritea spongicola]MBN3561242.1 thioredoxin fold domain-containing protein [Aliamphritea spongicola]
MFRQGIKQCIQRLCWLAAVMVMAFSVHAANPDGKPAIEMQAVDHNQEIPELSWYLDGFLELADDVAEAKERGHKIVLYFHQEGCPYCYNLVTQVFPEPRVDALMADNYELIELDIWGSRIVTLQDGTELEERQLAAMLKVQYTPTLIFLDETGTPERRVDGYRPPEAFLELVTGLVNGKSALPAAEGVGDQIIDLGMKADRPVAVQLVATDCAACEGFSKEVLSREDTQALLSGYRRLDVNLTENPMVKLPDGTTVAAGQWARELGISYLPAWIFLDSAGKEQFRVDAYVRAFHFNSALQYVASGAYKGQPEFQRYLHDQADQIRKSGNSVDILE